MSTFNIKDLESCYKQQSIKESFEPLYHALGFITAMASCPDDIQPSEWIEQLVISDDKTPRFDSEEQVKLFTTSLITWWNQCSQLFDHGGTIQLPNKLGITPANNANKALVEFSQGYLRGFDWLTESWQAALPNENVEAHRTVMVLNFILARFIDEKNMAKEEPDLYEQLPDTLGCFKVLPNLISGVGMLGKDIALSDEDFDNLLNPNSEFQSGLDTFSRTEKNHEPFKNTHRTIGRNESCPCGSGKKFKKCCLH